MEGRVVASLSPKRTRRKGCICLPESCPEQPRCPGLTTLPKLAISAIHDSEMPLMSTQERSLNASACSCFNK